MADLNDWGGESWELLQEQLAMPIVTLKNGLRIGNFSSPHTFRFKDGSELPRCSSVRMRRGSLHTTEAVDVEVVEGAYGPVRVENVDLTDKLTPDLRRMLSEAQELWEAKEVNYVLIPLRVLRAMQDEAMEAMGIGMRQYSNLHLPAGSIYPHTAGDHPFRVVRVADRETKVIYDDRFCI